MRDIDKLILHAEIAMREKLGENSHKPGFDMTITEGIEFLNGENRELNMAKYIYDVSKLAAGEIEAVKDIRREAADNANYAAMIIMACDKEIERLENVRA